MAARGSWEGGSAGGLQGCGAGAARQRVTGRARTRVGRARGRESSREIRLKSKEVLKSTWF